MTARKLKLPQPAADSVWATALSVAAGVARRATASEVDVLQAVTHELRRLKLRGGLSLLQPNGMLETSSLSYSSHLQASLSRLTGLPVMGFRFDPRSVKAFGEALDKKRAVFSPDQSQAIEQAIPPRLRALQKRIVRMLGRAPMIVAPLMIDDRPIGAVNVTARWLQPQDAQMVMALGDHIAIAIGHVRSRAKMQAALAREQLRNQVAETLASPLDLPTALERVIQLAMKATGADAGAIALIDPGSGTLRVPYLHGLPDELRLTLMPRGHGIAWQVIESRGPIRISDYSSRPDSHPQWLEAGLRAVVGVPLKVGDEVIGGMGLFTLREHVTFTEQDMETVQSIARTAAMAIKNADLYAEANRRAEEAQALIRTTRSISSTLDDEAVLRLVASEAKKLLHTDGSSIHLLDSKTDRLRCLVAEGPGAQGLLSMELERGQGLVGYVLESGKPLVANDPVSDPRSLQVPNTREDEPECIALAPLQIRKHAIGVMTVRRQGHDRPFQQADLELLAALASQAAVALDNAQLYSEILAQAQRLETQVATRTRDLALSEARYRALVENSLAGIWQANTEGRFVYLSQSFTELLGRPTGQLIGQVAWETDALTPKSRRTIRTRFGSRLKGELPPKDVYEIEIVAADGQRIPCLMTTSLIVDDEGVPQGATGLVLDISTRKILEAALRAERDRLGAILNNIGDAVLVTDAQGVIEYVNPAWERLNGYKAKQAIGKKPSLLKSGKVPPGTYADMWRTILEGKVWQGELVNQRKDGTTYDVSLIIHPVVDGKSQVINFVGVHHDISALKELDRLKTQFITDASHELRTPLTNIRLYVDLLRQTSSPEKSKGYIETLTRESDRLSDLINDLLSISRLESGVMPFEPSPTGINSILIDLAEDRRTLAAQRGLTLTIEADPSLPQAMGDRRLLTQVFTNLLTNAMNYTSPGDRIILRSKYKKARGDEWVVAEFEDSGPGIPTDELPMIFKRFFRGRVSQARNVPGTGLGLAICKEIVDLHGGKIAAENQRGRGVRFSVWLPLGMRSPPQSGRASPRQSDDGDLHHKS